MCKSSIYIHLTLEHHVDFFFSVVNTTVLHDPWWLTSWLQNRGYGETTYREGRLQVILGFLTEWVISASNPHFVQRSTVYPNMPSISILDL